MEALSAVEKMSPYLVIGGGEAGSQLGKHDQDGTSSDSGFEEESEGENPFYQPSKPTPNPVPQKLIDIHSKSSLAILSWQFFYH